ncbi:hypothetical protein [Bartonella tribocorum]|uniref:hypothetical protein n=1 Tax=Bartonella tribocorum TaxID=85701 RepID=UPI0002EFEAC8|nr:hypothetical protein [Bartonella tribocorum]CDO48476.1 phage integrase [Bartonella tribocorum]
MLLMNRLNARSVATLGAGKYNDGAGLLLETIIRSIFSPFLYKFDPHIHPTCYVQMSGFD